MTNINDEFIINLNNFKDSSNRESQKQNIKSN